jgi:acetyl-CoA acetyltransferase family protein
MLPNDPVIVSSYRTAIGRYGGALSSIRPDDMLAMLIKKTVEKTGIEINSIDEVIIGCANQAGEDNRNIARMALLLAGVPVHTPAITLNRLCASGLDAIIDGARRIITGEAKVILAGGVESMSRAPLIMAKPEAFKLGSPKIYDSALGWRFFNDKLKDITPEEPNGMTAERLFNKYQISRESQDNFALRSHKRALESQENGFFAREIISLNLPSGEFLYDEGPRKETSLEKLKLIKPVFIKDGTVTAGNSSTLNDGAALTIITSYEHAKSLGLKPRARILGFASAGVDPKIMGIGPVPATKKLLEMLKLSIADFSVIEINEAFAVQVLSVMKELKISEEVVNPHGGAIALGHPLGCSGARITATMVNHLESTKKALGLATLCVGVGQGVSMVVEAI